MAGGAQQSGQSENSSGIIWIIVAILVFSAIIWFNFKKAIITIFLKLKLAEISLLSFFTHRLDDIRYFIENILAGDPTQLAFADMVKVGEAIGDFIRIPVVIFILILAYIIFSSNSTRSFKRTYNMSDLAKSEKLNWPQVSPILNLDLSKTDIDKGPWAMAMTPMQFCKRHKLLDEHKRQPQEGMARKEWNRIDVTLRRGQASRLFAIQLGPLWQSVDKLPPHIKALFAIFAARFNMDSKGAKALLDQINLSSSSKLNFDGTDALLRKNWDNKEMHKKIQSHAYVFTVMATMLEAARDDGVQASADFLWLKPVDRKLWYMLNTVGRQTPFCEVAGPFSHWIAEKEIGRRLLVPMVEEATNALELSLKEIIYKPDEKTD